MRDVTFGQVRREVRSAVLFANRRETGCATYLSGSLVDSRPSPATARASPSVSEVSPTQHRCQRDRLLLVRSVCSARGRRAHSSRHRHGRNGRLPRRVHDLRDLWLGELLTHPNPPGRPRGDLYRCVGLPQRGCGRRWLAGRKNFRPLVTSPSHPSRLTGSHSPPFWLAPTFAQLVSRVCTPNRPSRLSVNTALS